MGSVTSARDHNLGIDDDLLVARAQDDAVELCDAHTEQGERRAEGRARSGRAKEARDWGARGGEHTIAAAVAPEGADGGGGGRRMKLGATAGVAAELGPLARRRTDFLVEHLVDTLANLLRVRGRLGSVFGSLMSSRGSPSSVSRDTKPSSSTPMHWSSIFLTKGTLVVCDAGTRSSIFLPVKMSCATKWHLAWPCFPVFDVETSMTLQGLPLIMMWPLLRICPASMG